MKTYIVVIECGHESFNGYDHKDPDRTYTIQARNEQSAKKKATKDFNHTYKNTRMSMNRVYIKE